MNRYEKDNSKILISNRQCNIEDNEQNIVKEQLLFEYKINKQTDWAK